MIEMKNKLINTFVESRLKQVLINDLDSYQVKDSNEAYNLQEIVNEKLSLSGLGEVIGYKIGCTNKSIQKELGVSNPIFGPIFKNKIINSNKTIYLKHFYSLKDINIYYKISFKYIFLKSFFKIYKDKKRFQKRILPLLLILLPNQILDKFLFLDFYPKS